MIGIYCIKNKINNKIYIGQSIDIVDRIRHHKSELRHARHFNSHLQRSFDRHGEGSFEFNVLELCEKCDLCKKEQYWIDHYAGNVYNLNMNIQDLSGENNWFFGKKHTDETKRKISESRRGKYLGKNNPNYGNTNNKAIKKEMATNRMKKLTVENVREIRRLLLQGLTHTSIAVKFNISRSIVTRINSGTRYALIQ